MPVVPGVPGWGGVSLWSPHEAGLESLGQGRRVALIWGSGMAPTDPRGSCRRPGVLPGVLPWPGPGNRVWRVGRSSVIPHDDGGAGGDAGDVGAGRGSHCPERCPLSSSVTEALTSRSG